MYYEDGFFDGVLMAAGGLGNLENGAAGTVYVERPRNNSRPFRSLKVDNNGRSPLTARVNQVGYVQIDYVYQWCVMLSCWPGLGWAVLYCVVLCCVLCCVALRCVALRCALLCCVILDCAVLYCAVMSCYRILN